MYVVVTLTTSPCPESEWPSRCVMDVIGPFASRAQADDFAITLPEWTTPHLMQVQDPGDWRGVL